MQKLYKIFIIIGSFCFFVLIAEGVIYFLCQAEFALDVDADFRLETPDYHYTPGENRLGFREEEITPAVQHDDVTRVLFLGDSFTYGTGLEDGQKRFSDLIEARLNRDPVPAHSTFHIYNAGVQGSLPEHWLRFFRQLMPHYRPDAVFAIFFLRDGTNMCTSLWCHEEAIRKLKMKYEKKAWYRYSNIGKFVGNRLMKKAFSTYYAGRIQAGYLGTEEERKTWRRQQTALEDIRDACRAHQIGFHLIVFPVLYGLESNYPFYGVEDEIIRFAEDARIPIFSLTPGFIGRASHTLWVSPHDQHPNEKGHQLAADALYPYLKENISVLP